MPQPYKLFTIYAREDAQFLEVLRGQLRPLENAFLKILRTTVEEHLNDPDFDVPQLCRAARLCNMQVNRKLKALTGKTPSCFIRSVRLFKAKELLLTTDLTISEIAYATGFNDPNYFSRSYSEEFGHTPSQARK